MRFHSSIAVAAVAVLSSSLASAYQLPSATRISTPAAAAQLRRVGAIRAAEETDPDAPPKILDDTLFTLEEREDGWNDVRANIKEQIKQREKPLQEIRDMYIDPAQRWARVISEEIEALRGDSDSAPSPPAARTATLFSPPPPAPPKPKPPPPAAAPTGMVAPVAPPPPKPAPPPKPPKKVDSAGLKAVGKPLLSTLGGVLDGQIKSKQNKAAKAKPQPKAASVSPASAPLNTALLFGVPGLALLYVAYDSFINLEL